MKINYPHELSKNKKESEKEIHNCIETEYCSPEKVNQFEKLRGEMFRNVLGKLL